MPRPASTPALALCAALAACALLAACGAEAAAGRRILVTGSSTVAPLFREIAKRYEATQTGLRIDVQTGGSTRGANDAQRGLADLGMMSRALAPEERARLRSWPIALDGLCLIVHGDNPVPSLSDAQVRAIYTGSVEDWAAVGGTPGPITVVHKAEGRATLELFLKFFELENPQVKPDVVVGDNEQGIKTVLGAPGAIGYVSIGTAAHHAGRGAALRLLPAGGVEASLDNVASGAWPMRRELILVAQATVGIPEAVRRLLDFARSEAVHDVIQSLSFVPIRG